METSLNDEGKKANHNFGDEASGKSMKSMPQGQVSPGATVNYLSGKYLYAIIPSGGEFSLDESGIEGETIYSIRSSELTAVVNDTEKSEYELTEKNVKRHNEVLRSLLGSHTVLPTEYGTVFKSGPILVRLLNKARTQIMEGLALVEDSVELGVKAIIKKELADSGITNHVKPDDISMPLRSLSVKSMSGELFSRRLLLNESFLVKKKNLDAFSEEVGRLGSSYSSVRLLYSGPWDHYNFVHIRVGKEGIEFKK